MQVATIARSGGSSKRPAQRACCPFFTFALVFEPQQGPLWLHLRGPAGTKEFVASMLTAVAERRTA